MATSDLGGAGEARSWFTERILLGMDLRSYLRSLLTPFDLICAAIVVAGISLFFHRFYAGLGATTHASQYQPWGLWIGFNMLAGIALSAGAFTIGAAVHLLGMRQYDGAVRPAILMAFLGYVMAILGLVADLGKPWNMVMAIRYQGTASALYEVAWCVMLYTLTLFLEVLLPVFEWLRWRRVHRVLVKWTLGLTVLSVVLSTMHQSALGSLFLIAPAKLHPLWYSPFIFIFFFVSAIAAGLSMVILERTLSHRFFRHRLPADQPDQDDLLLGLGRASALVLFAYFFLKLQGVTEGHHWDLIPTGWGCWFLVEIVGFVLVPSILFGFGARRRRVGLVKIAAVVTVAGIVLNRLNVSLFAFGWNRGERHVPGWIEVTISIALVAVAVVAFRWIVNRMPILSEDPHFASGER